MCWSGSEGIPGMDSTQEEQERSYMLNRTESIKWNLIH